MIRLLMSVLELLGSALVVLLGVVLATSDLLVSTVELGVVLVVELKSVLELGDVLDAVLVESVEGEREISVDVSVELLGDEVLAVVDESNDGVVLLALGEEL